MGEGYLDPYFYPDAPVLRNRLNIKVAAALEIAEREIVVQRMRQGAVPTGEFDLAHLQNIHRYLFQDVYDWAGRVRTVEMNKGGSQFLFRKFIVAGMENTHLRLVRTNFLRGLTADKFADEAGLIMGDVNHVHPFREGNGRTQLQYLKQLGKRAGHEIDLTQLDRPAGLWIDASIASQDGNYGLMTRLIRNAIAGPAI